MISYLHTNMSYHTKLNRTIRMLFKYSNMYDIELNYNDNALINKIIENYGIIEIDAINIVKIIKKLMYYKLINEENVTQQNLMNYLNNLIEYKYSI